ncbi:transposase [Methanosarcina mazei SarPi]|uniref:Transposase n=1 Tax=Methanosarcina mazei SarPi TaxID=1434115 RepID=A0A0E3RE84_METMZ|nr:transposase [Methanosarcina mazei SarPi]
MAFIKPKSQVWTLPPDIRDLIPSDHICYLVESFVDEMDFSEFEIRYDGSGHPAYHPCIMCKILIQSMLDRVRSSRAIARNVRENVVYIYLAENLQPDFRTISDFRKENEKLIAELFKNTVKAAKDLGVIGLEQLSTDGSMVKASASKNNVVLEEVLRVIGEYVNNELKKGIEVDKLEDEHFGNCRGYDQLNESGKYKVKAVVAKYIKQVNKDNSNNRKKEIESIVKEALNEFEKDSVGKVSLTDKESRFMKNKKGTFELAYNAQITVDHKLGIIVANDICQDRTDTYQLKSQIELVEENCGLLKEGTKICADSGYYCGNNIHYLNHKKLDPYIPEQKEVNKTTTENVEDNRFDIGNFDYSEENDEFICPENQRLQFLYEGYEKGRKRKYRLYKGTECKKCEFSKNCTKRMDGIRHLKIAEFSKERKQLADKMETEEAKKIYGQRKQVVEPAIGNYKENLGFREFLTRGLKSVKNEFNLVCAAANLRKIWIYLNKNEINGRENGNKRNFSF